jgi:hypothetical protein
MVRELGLREPEQTILFDEEQDDSFRDEGLDQEGTERSWSRPGSAPERGDDESI